MSQTEIINNLIMELDSMPDNTILVPAPEPHFEGHMIRQRECKGPEWLEILRETESTRVCRWLLRRTLINIRDNRITYKFRYYRLAQKVITGEVWKERYAV